MSSSDLKTKLATDWEVFSSASILSRGLEWLLARFNSNPGYAGKLDLVKVWLIEFDEQDLPGREIGLGEFGGGVLAGPSEVVASSS